MSAPDRRAMVERPGKDLSVRRRCALVGVARSGVYRPRPAAGADDLALMRRIDELHLELPFYGSRRMTFELNKEGRGVNRKRVQRLMRVMGIEALVPRPGTSKAAPGHKIYPYLLRGLKIVEPNHVWAADVTYIPMACGFLYLVAIIDWASRAVLAWRLSNTNDASVSRGGAGGGAASVRKGFDKLSRGYSIPIRAQLSPPRLSPASSRRPASRFRWTDAAVSWTTLSSNGCGAPSSMKRCI